LEAYPNPSTGLINLSSTLFEAAGTSIQVFNALGQIVLQEQIQEGQTKTQIELPSHLSNGLYTLQCIQKDQTVATKQIQLIKK